MKVLIINSSPNKNGHNDKVAHSIREALKDRGVDSEIFWLGKGDIRGCLSCYRCMEIDRCIQDSDIVNGLAEKMIAADGILVCAPVYFGGPNGALCNAFDRIFYSRTVKDQLLAGKPAGAVTVCNTMGAETALMGIYRYYNTAQMPIIGNMGYPTLFMKGIEEESERFHTVVNAVADNMARRLGAE